MARDLRADLASFQQLWKGGYFEGNPLDPMGSSSYGVLGYTSVLHATYLRCIKPYVKSTTNVIEIGPGRGAWTRTFLNAKEVWCLDALSADHNGFWQYVGPQPHVKYFQVQDFECQELPEDHFEFMFSFGAFCHIPFEGVERYMQALWPKMRSGARGFISISDYGKANTACDRIDELSVLGRLPFGERYSVMRNAKHLAWRLMKGRYVERKDFNESDEPCPGRWYHLGTERVCEMLNKTGFTVIDPDVGVNHRDPVIYFRK